VFPGGAVVPVTAAQLSELCADLAGSLATWAGRDDTRPQPEVRQAASAAVGTIDGMLRELHAVREQLASEIRASNDASAARVDALRVPGRAPGRAGGRARGRAARLTGRAARCPAGQPAWLRLAGRSSRRVSLGPARQRDLPPSRRLALQGLGGEHPAAQRIAAERAPQRVLNHLPCSLAIYLRFVWVGVGRDAQVEIAVRLVSDRRNQQAQGGVGAARRPSAGAAAWPQSRPPRRR
jgi:hypothetical protein